MHFYINIIEYYYVNLLVKNFKEKPRMLKYLTRSMITELLQVFKNVFSSSKI